MNLDKKTTAKGCIEYVDPDMRSVPVPIRIPAGFSVYKVCGNGGCMNPQHLYFVDGDTAHLIEVGLRDNTLTWLRKYFKVDPETLEQLEAPPPPPQIQMAEVQQPRVWLPRR